MKQKLSKLYKYGGFLGVLLAGLLMFYPVLGDNSGSGTVTITAPAGFTGSATITVTVSGTSNGSSVSSAPINLTVNSTNPSPSPSPSPSPQPTPPPGPLSCSPADQANSTAPYQFSFSASGGTGSYTQWALPSACNPVGPSSGPSFSINCGSTSLSAQVRVDDSGGNHAYCNFSAGTGITPPTVNFSINGHTSGFQTDPGTPLNIVWSSSDASSCSADTNSSTIDPNWHGAIALSGTATDTSGSGTQYDIDCYGTSGQPGDSVTKTIVVSPKLYLNAIISGGSSTSCSGTTSANAVPVMTLKWNSSLPDPDYGWALNFGGGSWSDYGPSPATVPLPQSFQGTTLSNTVVGAFYSYDPGVVGEYSGDGYWYVVSNAVNFPVPWCTGNITVNATLNGSPWTAGSVNYTTTKGAENYTDNVTMPHTRSSLINGNWQVAYVSGGPGGTPLTSITPSATQSIPGNVASKPTLTYTMNFGSPPPVFDFSMSNGGTISIPKGSSSSTPINLTLVSGSTVPVTLTASADGLYPGINGVTFSSPSCSPTCSDNMTVAFTNGATVGETGSITVTGVGGGQTHTTDVNFIITAPATPPTAPGGGPTANNATSGGAVACGAVKLTWTDNSNNETGFYVYRNTDGSAPTTGQRIYDTGSANITSYTYTTPDNNNYYYFVSAYNAGGESAKTAMSNNPFASTACAASLVSSDKDIVAINGKNIGSGLGNQCGGTDALPANTNLKLNDKLKFSVNLCSSGNATVTSISLADTLTNLKQPSAGWNAKYDDGSGGGEVPLGTGSASSISLSVSGSTITFSGIPPIPPSGNSLPTIRRITFEAQLTVPAGFTGTAARFQNCFNASYNSGNSWPSCTPLLPFYIGQAPPTETEVP